MKQHQSEIRRQLPIDIKLLESFPPFWTYELAASTELTKRLRVGAMAGYTSTGGRMHYRDYSGTIVCDQVTTARSLAAIGELVINPDDKFLIGLTCKAGAAFSRYSLDLLLEVNQQRDTENLKFKSTNFFVEPGFTVSKHLYSGLSAIFSGGYNINVTHGSLSWDEDKNLYLIDNSGEKVRLDWTGYRINIGLSVVL